MLARARAQVNNPIRVTNGLFIVLHNQERIAQIAHALQRADQPHVVALMKANTRLVEHVQHAHQPRANLRRQPNALRLAARKGPRRAMQRQVIQADVDHKTQPILDFLEHLIPYRQIAFR